MNPNQQTLATSVSVEGFSLHTGEKVTLKLVAEYADAWNSFGPPATYLRKNQILDEWCAKVDRDPADIERTVAFLSGGELEHVDAYLEAGATHLILGLSDPFDLAPVHQLLQLARG